MPVKSSSDYPSRVRARVRAAIAASGKAARVVAADLGWSQSYMAHRLTGRQPFSVDDLAAIADALGISPEELTADREEVPA